MIRDNIGQYTLRY